MIARADMLAPTRPQTRADCVNGPRPCPWAGCRHHLLLTVSEETGAIRLNHGHDDPTLLMETCALDVAERGGVVLAEVAAMLNLTRERIRQIEERGLVKLRARRELGDAMFVGWTR